MAFSIPVLEGISPFDANDTFDFKFRYDKGGTQFTRHNLVIETNRGDGTDFEVYDVEVYSFDPVHTYVPTLAISPLINGKQYKAKIRIGTASSWSDFSQWMIFYVHTTPIVDILNISQDGIIYNHIDTFQASYITPAIEEDPLISYQFFLYDEHFNLINEYKKKYITQESPVIEQTITNLEYGFNYKVRLITESEHGMKVDIVRDFVPIYDFPILGETTFLVELLKDKPSVKISFEVLQTNGNLESEDTPKYEDNTIVNLLDDVLYYDTDFSVVGNFILKIWTKKLVNGTTFCKLKSDYGGIDFALIDNRVHVFKYLNGSLNKNHILNNEVINPEKDIFILLKQIDDVLGLTVEQLEG